jgi:hypothetical protein
MITIHLKGGLGNQMFQYATARALSLRYGSPLTFNTEYFENIPKKDVPRKYQLDIFNLPQDIKIKKSISPVRKLWHKIYAKICSENTRVYFACTFLTFKQNAHLSGYFQRPEYFSSARETLLEEFSFSITMSDETERIKDRLLHTNSVAVNVRRGDYLRPDYANVFGVIPMSYYEEAISHMRQVVTEPLFCVFSDDPEWVASNFNLPNALFIGTDRFKDYEQLFLMSKCKHNILANSSFAWWGAWLGQYRNKIVFAPRQWTIAHTADELSVLPKEWIQL